MINFICSKGYYFSTKLREFFLYWQCNGIFFKKAGRLRAATAMQAYFDDAWAKRIEDDLQVGSTNYLDHLRFGGYVDGPSAPIVDMVPVIKKNVYSVKQNNVERLYIITPQKKTTIKKRKNKAKK